MYFFLTPEFFGCLGRLYSCEESGKANCPDTERCLSIEPVVAEVDTIDTVQNKDGKHNSKLFSNLNFPPNQKKTHSPKIMSYSDQSFRFAPP